MRLLTVIRSMQTETCQHSKADMSHFITLNKENTPQSHKSSPSEVIFVVFVAFVVFVTFVTFIVLCPWCLTWKEMGTMSHSWLHVWLTDMTPAMVVIKAAVTPICDGDDKKQTRQQKPKMMSNTNTHWQENKNNLKQHADASCPARCLIKVFTL